MPLQATPPPSDPRAATTSSSGSTATPWCQLPFGIAASRGRASARSIAPNGSAHRLRTAWTMLERSLSVVAIGCALVVLCDCRTAGLQRAYMSLDESGDRRRTTFDTQTNAIYCIGELASGRADVTVSARIRAPVL